MRWVAMAVFWSSSALACTCGWAGFAHALASSSVAFEGVSENDPFESNYTDYIYRIRVTRVHKGEVASVVYVRTPASTCGLYPAIGDPWIFLPRENDWLGYRTAGCDGSTALSDLSPAERALLGAGYAPLSSPPLLVVSASLVGVVLVAISWGIIKRRRARR